jgi:hypothetical protein
LFEVVEDAGAAIGEGGCAFDADGAFFDGQLNELLEADEDGEIIARFLGDEELNDLANSLLIDGAVRAQAGAQIFLGALTCMAVDFPRNLTLKRSVIRGAELLHRFRVQPGLVVGGEDLAGDFFGGLDDERADLMFEFGEEAVAVEDSGFVGLLDDVFRLPGGIAGKLLGANPGGLFGFSDDRIGLLIRFLDNAEASRFRVGEFLFDLRGVGHGLFDGIAALLQDGADRFPGEYIEHHKENGDGKALRKELLRIPASHLAGILQVLDDISQG